jgi:hypothetical protein
MPIFEYECPAGHVTERIELSSRGVDYIWCSLCAGALGVGIKAAKRISTSSFKLADVKETKGIGNGVRVETTRKWDW